MLANAESDPRTLYFNYTIHGPPYDLDRGQFLRIEMQFNGITSHVFQLDYLPSQSAQNFPVSKQFDCAVLFESLCESHFPFFDPYRRSNGVDGRRNGFLYFLLPLTHPHPYAKHIVVCYQ